MTSRPTPGDAAALTRPEGAVGDSLVVAAWTMVSRISGFGRVAVTAAVLGPTYLGNTYQVTNSLPNIIYYGLLAGSLVSSLLVPALVGHIDRGDRRSCERVAGGAVGLVLVGLAVVLPVALLAVPPALAWGALGSVPPETAAAQADVARVLLLLLLPQVFLYAVVACSSAVMHAHRRFALAAAAPVVENVGCIAVLAVTALRYPVAPGIGDIPTGQLVLLGAGTTAAVAAHALLQWWGARRTGVTLRPTAGWREPEVRALARRAVPMLAQTSLEALQLVCVLVVVNGVTGGVVAYQVAAQFLLMCVALGATPVALSLLPRLARLDRTADGAALRDTAVRGLRFALFVAAPAAVTLAALAPALATGVSYGRMATGDGAALVAAVLLVLAPAVLGETAFLVAAHASYARGDTWGPLRSTLVKSVVCLAVLGVALSAQGPPVVVLAGLAVSLAAVAGAAHRVRALLRGLPPGTERLLPSALRTTAAGAVTAVPLLLAGHLLAGAGAAASLAGALAACAVAGVVYLAVLRLLRADEPAWLLAALRRPARGPA